MMISPLIITVTLFGAVSAAANQRLLVFLVDGMRWDYLKRDTELQGFERIINEGVYVKHVTPIFPSLSYPNWYTIATGLYSESHGIIENNMYDEARNDKFLMGPHPNVSHAHWWNRTEPIWIAAEKNGIKASVHYWDGCQVEIGGFRPTSCDSYRTFWMWFSAKTDTTNMLVELLNWFQQDDKNRLAMVYFEGPDDAGHMYGPDSNEARQAVRDVDAMLLNFQEHLDKSPLKENVNLMVVSDHGMEDVSSSVLIQLNDFGVNEDIHLTLGSGALLSIFPKPGKIHQVYERIKEQKPKGLHVYLKEDIPEQYHFRNADLTPPILLLADSEYYLADPGVKGRPGVKGTHGFDPFVGNSQMSTLMLSKGPAFKKGYKGGPLQQTDHYNVFCHILGIEPHPNNGSWERVKDLLVSSA